MRIYLTDKDTVVPFENNLVDLTAGDTTYKALEPRRLFPVSRPDEYVSLLDADGVEIAQIRRLADLNPESRAAVVNSLNDYYLVPTITRIVSATEKYGTLRWTVQTERGEISFDIRNRNHDIRVNSDGSIRVRDSNDNRYCIPDWKKLDKHSKALLLPDL